jgi:hypothetical protein
MWYQPIDVVVRQRFGRLIWAFLFNCLTFFVCLKGFIVIYHVFFVVVVVLLYKCFGYGKRLLKRRSTNSITCMRLENK